MSAEADSQHKIYFPMSGGIPAVSTRNFLAGKALQIEYNLSEFTRDRTGLTTKYSRLS